MTKFTDSTDPSLRMATVTSGSVCGCFAMSRIDSSGVFNWILRAHVSAYDTSSAFGSARPHNRPRRMLLSE